MTNTRLAACTLLLLSAFVDTLNGVFEGLPLSIAFKAVVTALALATLNLTHLKIVGAVVGYYMISVLYTVVFHELIAPDVIWALRNTMLLVATLFFVEQLSGPNHRQWVKTICALSAAALCVFGFNIFLGLLGIGSYQYEYGYENYGAGGKGFITAGNELVTAVLAICGVLVLRIGNLSIARRFIMYSAMAILVILTSTKSGMLGLLLLFGLREGTSSDVSNLRRVVMLMVLLVVAWIGIDYAINSFAGRRFIYFFETDGIARAIFSNRNYWASNALSSFFSHATAFDFLLGMGADEIAYANHGKYIVEMDVVDFLVTYGLIGVFVSHFPFFYALYITRRHSSSQLASSGGIILFMCLATFTGHVLNGGTSAPYLAAFLAMTALATNTRHPNAATRQSRTRSRQLRKQRSQNARVRRLSHS